MTGIKTRYRMMDCLKGISCLAVILIHYNFPCNLGLWIRTASKFAVPYFFFVSGFFMTGSDGILHREKTVSKIRHIIALIIGAGLFYALFFCVWQPMMYDDFSLSQYRKEHLTWIAILKFFVSNKMIAYDHLWFLFALLYCYLILIPFDKKKCGKWLILPAGILMICFLVLSEWNTVLGIHSSFSILDSEDRIFLSNTFLFRALPFVLLGMGLRQYEDILRDLLKNIKPWVYILFIVIGTATAIIERFLFKESQFYAGSYIVLISLCLLSIAQPGRGVSWMEHIGRDLSMYAYVLHIAVGKVYDLIVGKFHFWGYTFYDYTRALIILVFTLLVAEMLHRINQIQRSHRYRFL